MAESVALRADGHVEIPLPGEDDPGIFLRTISAIHGPASTIPKSYGQFADAYSTTRLIEITDVVDRLGRCGALRDRAQAWLDRLTRNKRLDGETPELLPWLPLAWAYGLEGLYRKLSAAAIEGSTHALDGENPYQIPIPPNILSECLLFLLHTTSVTDRGSRCDQRASHQPDLGGAIASGLRDEENSDHIEGFSKLSHHSGGQGLV